MCSAAAVILQGGLSQHGSDTQHKALKGNIKDLRTFPN